MRNFYSVLLNTLIANVTTSYLWFALTFWIYLETKSVLATGIVGGSYMLLVAMLSLVFGVVVDHNKKKKVMVWASMVTLAFYVLAGVGFMLHTEAQLTNLHSYAFYILAGLILLGSVVENMRNIALSTIVTLLVPKDTRDKANGMVGSVQGIGFMVTSVFSGLSVGFLGMGWTMCIAIILTLIAAIHVLFVHIPEKDIFHDPELAKKKIDIKGSIAAIRAVPGLGLLIIFTTFNNFVGGVFMALMDPYGLTLFSVQWWGIVLGITSTGFVVGGAIVAKRGLGKNPIRSMLLANIAVGAVGLFFALREWWPLYVGGIFVYMCIFPVVEAAEQTIIQRVVPVNRQGRVFGLAQAIESASSPISAFLIAPIAQFWLIPFMKSDSGKATFGWLLGSGEARGIALVFILASLIMIATVLFAFTTKAYRDISNAYQKA
ncbi:MAG: transporter, family, multidrug efflux protein [Patescibacteria group bacterium]|nr:transporter, family, multidrug efflux protein [Patescibacteria group bacterium]